MELFDETKKIGYETTQEIEYRKKKEEYNKQIMTQVREVFAKRFSDRQREVFTLMFEEGLTLTETSRRLSVTPQTVLKIKSRFAAKIKKYIRYKFDFVTE